MDTMQQQGKNKTTVRKVYEDMLNTGKFELLAQVVSEDFTGTGGKKGPAAFAENVKPVIAAFPDIKWTVEDLIAEGNKVVAKWFWKGTNTGALNGIAPTHKQVTHHAISIFEFRGDKIINTWMQADRLGFFQQIGVIPPGLVPPPPVKK